MENEKRDVWVIESTKGWTVDLGVDDPKPIYHVSQATAITAGETLARVLGRALFIKDRTGKIHDMTPRALTRQN